MMNKEQAVDKKEFVAYLDKQLSRFNMSETKLAKCVGIAQKSVNRYHQGLTCPSPEVQRKIMEYFDILEKGFVEPGHKAYVMEDEDGEEYYVDEDELTGIDEETNLEEYVEYPHLEEFKQFSLKCQRYITNHFSLFCYLRAQDIEFLKRISRLGEQERAYLKQYLEGVPVCESMILPKAGTEPIGTEDTYFVMERLARRVRYRDCPKSFQDDKKQERGKDVRSAHEYQVVRYREACKDYFWQTTEFSIPNNLFQKVEETFSYNTDDWYMLYLLYRIRCIDKGMPGGKECRVTDEFMVGAREYALWKYLEALEGDKRQKADMH